MNLKPALDKAFRQAKSLDFMQRQFSRPHYRYFFYGMCSEDQITSFIQAAEAKGCEFVAILPSFVQPPQSPLTLHAPQSQRIPIPVLRVFVRCLESDWPAVEKAMQEEAEGQKT